ncbi:MAG: IS1634 family transposase [Erysipelotrichaceae bacterium]
MAFFLKKQKQNNRTYLHIYESFYSPITKNTKHKFIKSMGSVQSLSAEGIKDPVYFAQQEVDRMNLKRDRSKVKLISDVSPVVHLGYFPLAAIMNKLQIKKYVDLFKLSTDFSFDLYDVLSSLVYARVIKPCSKYKTYYEVIPNLYDDYQFSYDQLLEGLAFYGNDYQKFVELFNTQVDRFYKLDTSTTYFDCTNFYFEIDREDDFRRKGVSKENRKNPLVGLGLLLDRNQIPCGMKIFPGNESEKPVIRDVISSLKQRNEIEGRTIQVADKGLNCAQNILEAKKNGDGYIFSRSVRNLEKKEVVWLLLDNDYVDVKDSDGKILYRYKECVDRFSYDYITEEGRKVKVEITEKRVATYNPRLAVKQKAEINRMVEKVKNLQLSKAKRSEYGDAGKYVTFSSTSKGKVTDDKVNVSLNQAKIEDDLSLTGYNLLVSSEINMKALDIYRVYHNLWRIEESFRIMKSDLDARPVHLQKQETIQGHFLICYIAVLLQRIFQFHILKNQYSSSDIINLFKNFNVVKSDRGYLNLMTSNKFVNEFSAKANLPINHLNLTPTKLKKVFNYRP